MKEKMKNKIMALFLTLAMTATIISGCGSTQSESGAKESDGQTQTDTKEDTAASEETGEAADAAAQAIADRKAKAEESGEYQKVVFAFYTWTGRPAGTDRIQEKLNERLRETLGLEVELLVMDSASYAQNVRLMLSSGEQIDIYNSCPLGFTSVVNDGFCYDLEEEELIQTYGKGILDTINPDYVKACRIDGTLYGLPQMRDIAMGCGGYCIPQRYLDEVGFDYDSMYEDPDNKDIIYTDYATIDEIFAKLYEAYPDKYVYGAADNMIHQGSIVDGVGGIISVYCSTLQTA